MSDLRSRHWSKTNESGFCQLCKVNGYPDTLGTLEHMLLVCPALINVRENMRSLWSKYSQTKPILLPIIDLHTQSSNPEELQLHMHFLLDPSSCPIVIRGVQEHGQGLLSDVLYLTRTWCHSHHSKRLKLLRLYNIII